MSQPLDADAATLLQAAPLRVGISTRALFDLEEEHGVFLNRGVEAYARLQRDREAEPLRTGCGYAVIERLLAMNRPGDPPIVEVVLLSRNSPDLSLRSRHGPVRRPAPAGRR